MNGHTNSDSDSNDEDFVPASVGEYLSEDDSSEAGEEDVSDEVGFEETRRGKRKSLQKKSGAKRKFEEEEERSKKVVVKDVSEEEDKLISDMLWNDFKTTNKSSASGTKQVCTQSQDDVLKENEKKPITTNKRIKEEFNSSPSENVTRKDTAPQNQVIECPPNKSQVEKSSNRPLFQRLNGIAMKSTLTNCRSGFPAQNNDSILTSESATVLKPPVINGSNGVVLDGVYERVKDPSPLPSGGLKGLLKNMGKKDKLGTLEASKIAWSRFTQSHDLSEDLKAHNQGKNGYLDKLDFLDRANVRQFEVDQGTRLSSKRSYK